MTVDFGIAGAPVGGNAWLHLTIIVKSVQLCWRVSSSRSAFGVLEPFASKGARWVLRRGGSGNASSLSDQPTRSAAKAGVILSFYKACWLTDSQTVLCGNVGVNFLGVSEEVGQGHHFPDGAFGLYFFAAYGFGQAEVAQQNLV